MILRVLSDNSLIGMLILSIAFTTIGVTFVVHTLYKGRVAFITRSGYVYYRKLSDYKHNLDFGYVHAFVFTMLFGPVSIILGFIAFFTLVTSI